MQIHIMGGGTSNKETKSVRPMIVTNRDLIRYPYAEYFVTCDISFTKHNQALLKEAKPVTVLATDITETRLTKEDFSPYNMVINASNKYKEFGRTWDKFNTGCNSGFSAVQFAILLGYTEIHLHGIDLVTQNNETHWHKGYGHSCDFLNNRMNGFYLRFKEAIESCEGVKFISHSPISRLNGLKNVTVA